MIKMFLSMLIGFILTWISLILIFKKGTIANWYWNIHNDKNEKHEFFRMLIFFSIYTIFVLIINNIIWR